MTRANDCVKSLWVLLLYKLLGSLSAIRSMYFFCWMWTRLPNFTGAKGRTGLWLSGFLLLSSCLTSLGMASGYGTVILGVADSKIDLCSLRACPLYPLKVDISYSFSGLLKVLIVTEWFS